MATQLSAAQWIEQLALQPHPEGGFFRETYRSVHMVPSQALPDRYAGARSLATTIFYLLRGEEVSRLHRLRTDENWYYHAGNPLKLHQFNSDGSYRHTCLGLDPGAGAEPQRVMPAGCWFGAEVATCSEGGYTLVSCSLAPGFEFADFELGDPEELLAAWPEYAALIRKLSRVVPRGS